jgi:hypothetical protein
MAEPSKKDPRIENFLENALGRTTAITTDTCAICKGPATEFKDRLSKKEYTISGMCQKCQDSVFGG